MLSIINFGVRRCCHDNGALINKSDYISQYTPWVDLAIGIILCILGSLASHGIIPLNAIGTNCMLAAGSIQIILGVLMYCLPCCKQGYPIVKTAINERSCNPITTLMA